MIDDNDARRRAYIPQTFKIAQNNQYEFTGGVSGFP
jgi:hypothetical protein